MFSANVGDFSTVFGEEHRPMTRARADRSTVEVFVQFEDASVVESQTFPNCVAALHGRIEQFNASLIAMASRPLIFTIRSRFFSLNCWSMKRRED
jgi:hypothetical protein